MRTALVRTVPRQLCVISAINDVSPSVEYEQLHPLHKRGVCHGDLKAENICVDNQQKCTVIDYPNLLVLLVLFSKM